MKVTAIRCPKCNCVIWSRACHDFHNCDCGNVAIDGGRDYCRIVGNVIPKTFQIEVDCDEQEAYNDWNFNEDKFGCIRIGKDISEEEFLEEHFVDLL